MRRLIEALGFRKMVALVRKAYFWVFVALQAFLAGIEFSPKDYANWDVPEHITYITLPFGIAALFGHAYKRKLLRQWVWVIVTTLILLNDVAYGVSFFLYHLFTSGILEQTRWLDLAYPIASVLIFAPYWVGISRYSFSKQFWRET